MPLLYEQVAKRIANIIGGICNITKHRKLYKTATIERNNKVMTEIEKWLKMYGNYPVKKTSTSKKDELNERIRRKLSSRPLFKTTPEERLADLKL